MTQALDFLKVLLGKRFPYKFVYSNEYWMLPIGKHVFPVRKYRMIYEKLLLLGARREHFLAPEPAAEEDVLLVHSPKYLRKLATGTLSKDEVAILELPYSPALYKFALLQVGGTALAVETALETGLAVHIGGGFHHAFPDHGEGFCVLNDVAVAIERVRRAGRTVKVMVVDCDLHQGNGTAAVFAGRKDVLTFSIHQMDIYPAEKPESSVDVGLWAGDGDEAYLRELRAWVPKLYGEFEPGLVVYLAGADPYEGDQLGGLRLTKDGLKERDRVVIDGARDRGIPVAVVLAGGYAAEIEDTVAVHLNTIRVAQRAQRINPQP
jgi:acetoin utilization deacetylase AcuC-like enzyme